MSSGCLSSWLIFCEKVGKPFVRAGRQIPSYPHLEATNDFLGYADASKAKKLAKTVWVLFSGTCFSDIISTIKDPLILQTELYSFFSLFDPFP